MIGFFILLYLLIDFLSDFYLGSLIKEGHPLPFISILIIGGILFVYSMFHKISNAPLAVALETVWGNYTGRVKKWGIRVFLPYFPFLWGYKEIEVTMRNFDLENVKIQHPSGDMILFEGSLNWFPRYYSGKELVNYISVGGYGNKKDDEKVGNGGPTDLLVDIISDTLRRYISTGGPEGTPLSLDEVRVKGEEFCNLISGALAGKNSATGNSYKNMDINPKHGVSDVHGFGLSICRNQIKNITTEGDVTKEIQNRQKEIIQKTSDEIDTEGEIKRIKKALDEMGIDMETLTTEIKLLLWREIREFKAIKEDGGNFYKTAGVEGLISKLLEKYLE